MRREHKDLIAFRDTLEHVNRQHVREVIPVKNAALFDLDIFGHIVEDRKSFTGTFFESLHLALHWGTKPPVGMF